MTLFMTWFWRQNPNRAGYDAAKVNRWASMLGECLTMPHELAVVTDIPEGLDPSLRIIPLPRDFDGIRVPGWSEASGLPQCYRRLKLFAPDAADYFGAEDIVSMDLDSLFLRNLDHLFAEPADFRMFAGTSRIRPYNGSMVRIRAGARPKVWREFSADPVGVATRARKLFIGSDQAVISMILGKGERTWSEREGVFHYSPKFERLHGGAHSARPPGNMAMLFFPGNIKPWDRQAMRLPWIADRWAGVRPSSARQPIRLRAYRDPKGWGQEFKKAAEARGMFCSLFTRSRMVPTGYAFVRLDQQGGQRDISKRIVADLNRQGIPTLPTAREAIWYDDKGAQIEALRRWMPRTVHFRDKRQAEAWLETEATFPLVSKSIDGAASMGVRLLATKRDAVLELQKAFAAPGIRSVYERWQLGYVYWQDLVPDQPCDYRVVVIGGYVYGLVRAVRPGDFRASGSGTFELLTLADDRQRAAAALAVEIADELRTDWMAFDIVFAKDGRPLVLEMSSAWTMRAYAKAPCFSRKDLAPTGRFGADSFAIAVEIMETMHANAQAMPVPGAAAKA